MSPDVIPSDVIFGQTDLSSFTQESQEMGEMRKTKSNIFNSFPFGIEDHVAPLSRVFVQVFNDLLVSPFHIFAFFTTESQFQITIFPRNLKKTT